MQWTWYLLECGHYADTNYPPSAQFAKRPRVGVLRCAVCNEMRAAVRETEPGYFLAD
jgi:hypothetical protein